MAIDYAKSHSAPRRGFGPLEFVALALALSCSAACAVPAQRSCGSAGKQDLLAREIGEMRPDLPGSEAAELASLLVFTECEHGVDAMLLMAIAVHESRLRTEAVSSAGRFGLLQLDATVARSVARQNGWAWTGDESLLEPDWNLRIGAAHLSALLSEFDDLERALTAFRSGPGPGSALAATGRGASLDSLSIVERYERLQSSQRAATSAASRRELRRVQQRSAAARSR